MLGLSVPEGLHLWVQTHAGAGEKGEGEGAAEKCHRLTLVPVPHPSGGKLSLGRKRGLEGVLVVFSVLTIPL